MGQKKFGSKKNYGPNENWIPKKFESKKSLGPEKFWSRKNLGPEQILTPKYLKQKKFGAKTFGLGSVGLVG